jgi:hypothetical protein
MLTYAAFNEALRIYKHDVYLHDVKVCEGSKTFKCLRQHTSAYVAPEPHPSVTLAPLAVQKKTPCFLAPFPAPSCLSLLFAPCFSPCRPFPASFARSAPRAACPRARARAALKKKNGVGLARHLQQHTPAFAGFRALCTHNVHSQKAA